MSEGSHSSIHLFVHREEPKTISERADERTTSIARIARCRAGQIELVGKQTSEQTIPEPVNLYRFELGSRVHLEAWQSPKSEWVRASCSGGMTMGHRAARCYAISVV